MTEGRRWEDSTLSRVARLWPFILAFATVAVAWGAMKADQRYLEKNLFVASQKVDNHETRISKVEQAIVSMADRQKEQIEMQKEVLRRLR